MAHGRNFSWSAPNTNLGAAIVALGQVDLPERVEAWTALDRIVWQDLDTAALTPAQLTGLRGWLAAGGRLVILGGTAGPRVLAGLPDDLLPYRPTATIDTPPTALTGLVGEPPADAVDVPALAGTLVRGRALATVGDRVVAAEASVGAGSVAILGVDPTVGWIGRTSAADHAWRRFLPARSGSAAPALTDDNQLVEEQARGRVGESGCHDDGGAHLNPRPTKPADGGGHDRFGSGFLPPGDHSGLRARNAG